MKIRKNQKGFTLIEMCVCIVTLVLMAIVCSTGTGIAMKGYQNSLFESDSQMLEDTVDMIMSDMFRYARDLNQTEQKFTNYAYGIHNGSIKIVDHEGNEGPGYFRVWKDSSPTTSKTLLIGENVYTRGMYVEDFAWTYDTATKTVIGSYTIKSHIRSDLSKECKFTYRTVAAE